MPRHIEQLTEELTSPEIRLVLVTGAADTGPAQRAAYRQKKFRSYFRHSRRAEFSLDDIAIRFTRDEPDFKPENLNGRLVSLRDEKNTDFALGVIEQTDTKEKRLVISLSLAEHRQVAAIIIGSANLRVNLGTFPAKAPEP